MTVTDTKLKCSEGSCEQDIRETYARTWRAAQEDAQFQFLAVNHDGIFSLGSDRWKALSLRCSCGQTNERIGEVEQFATLQHCATLWSMYIVQYVLQRDSL